MQEARLIARYFGKAVTQQAASVTVAAAPVIKAAVTATTTATVRPTPRGAALLANVPECVASTMGPAKWPGKTATARAFSTSSPHSRIVEMLRKNGAKGL